ncbi:MAG: hypothetical protein KA296_16845 [Marinobacter sp.]|nr:hypothetical protein [Marinobacter sp.]
MDCTPKSTDAAGETDFGNVDSLLVLDDGFNVSEDFGTVNIKGGELSFEVHT